MELRAVVLDPDGSLLHTETKVGGTFAAEEGISPPALKFVRVIKGRAADKAGIQEGDLLISVAGSSARGPASEAAELYLQSRAPQTIVPVTVLRGSKKLDTEIVIGGRKPVASRNKPRAD